MRFHQGISARVGKGVAVALGLVKDFVRTKTTLVTEAGKSTVNTKLDHDTPAYKALIKKHSYIGEATVFGRRYDAEYAPLTSDDGRLTGALFVAAAK